MPLGPIALLGLLALAISTGAIATKGQRRGASRLAVAVQFAFAAMWSALAAAWLIWWVEHG
jgi:hypothetical protein